MYGAAAAAAAAADAYSYPPIEPTEFDLIVLGTGLPASIIAAASSASGKSVLHLDPNSFYGSHFSSLSLHNFSSFLHSQSHSPASASFSSSSGSCGSDCVAVNIETRPVYAHIEVSSYTSQPAEESRKFSLDLAGPRVLFCADTSVDLLCRSGAHTSVDFKSVEEIFVCDSGADGRFWSLPGSRAAIFKDRSLALTEKNQLMRFFKLVQEHLSDSSGEQGPRISEEDLESPFVEFLTKMRLPAKIKSAILYAIAMADHDQGNIDGEPKNMLKTSHGIDRLALYQSSVGRLQNASGALLYPMYGQGELPQAFCRRAAVKGCIYVLRMPVIALLLDQASEHYRGIKLSSGQELFSQHLVLDPSFTVRFPLASNAPDFVPLSPSIKGSMAKVSRAICITSSSLKADLSSFLVVYPPRSLYPEQVTSIRVLQIGSNLAVCPPGMFVVYFSTLCEDVNQGKKLLNTGIDTLFTTPASGENNDDSSLQKGNTEEVKPTLLWRALYIQELTMIQDSFESINFTPVPDGSLDYNDVLNATKKIFQKLYPDEGFFPGNLEDDGDFSVESENQSVAAVIH